LFFNLKYFTLAYSKSILVKVFVSWCVEVFNVYDDEFRRYTLDVRRKIPSSRSTRVLVFLTHTI